MTANTCSVSNWREQEIAYNSRNKSEKVMKATTKRQWCLEPHRLSFLVAIVSFLALTPTSRAQICGCSPSTFTFTLDFSLLCPGNFTEGPGINRSSCAVDPVGGSNTDDEVPVVVDSIQILELDQMLQVVNQSEIVGDLTNGYIFSYISTVITAENINDTRIPGGLQLNLMGSNEEGVQLVNFWLMEYANECGVVPILEEGSTAGWTVFANIGPPNEKSCPARTANPTMSPSGASDGPTVAPTSFSPSDTGAPTFAPTGGLITEAPTVVFVPTDTPSGGTTDAPSPLSSTDSPTLTFVPTAGPDMSEAPTLVTETPSTAPSFPSTTNTPSEAPAEETQEPSNAPTMVEETASPSNTPTMVVATSSPSSAPTMVEDTPSPTNSPSMAEETQSPSNTPSTVEETSAPTTTSMTQSPTKGPAPTPTEAPTVGTVPPTGGEPTTLSPVTPTVLPTTLSPETPQPSTSVPTSQPTVPPDFSMSFSMSMSMSMSFDERRIMLESVEEWGLDIGQFQPKRRPARDEKRNRRLRSLIKIT